MKKGSINSIESFGAVDGPGIRVVVFMNGCTLRCKYCHNPEMWRLQDYNYTAEELVNKVLRFEPYFRSNNGGVTFSGGEPLFQAEFITEVCKKLKKDNIHIALDTSGQYIGDCHELLDFVDLIIYDIKDITEESYKSLTNGNINTTIEFLKIAKEKNKKFWIRQVIVPGLHDNKDYLNNLSLYIQKHFFKESIERIEFLPYHKLGSEKYIALNINNPYERLEEMDKEQCNKLYLEFMKIYESKF